MEPIGKQLKRIRLLNGLSVQKFANYVGLNADRLRKWEERGVNPKDGDAEIISNYFEVPIDELHRIEKFKFSSKKVQKEPVENLPPPESETVKTLVNTNAKLVDQSQSQSNVIASLTSMLERKLTDASKEIQVMQVSESVQSCLEKIARAGVFRKYWKSEGEGLKQLGRFLVGDHTIKSE